MERKEGEMLSGLFVYRSAWMGLAILWVMFYHSGFDFEGIKPLVFFQNVGYAGVDIFLFASGIGCYHSLDKNPDPLAFMKRRLLRLLPSYWPFLIIYCTLQVILYNESARSVLGNFLGVQHFTGQGGAYNWYISAILVLYLISPVLKCLADKMNKKWKLLIVLAVLVSVSIPFWENGIFIVFVSRFPVFFLGMYFGSAGKRGVRLPRYTAVIAFLAFAAGIALLYVWYKLYEYYLWNYALYWYPFIIAAPALCIWLSCIFMKAGKGLKWLDRFLSYIGKHSFEIFLVHGLIFGVYRLFIHKEILPENNLLWLMTSIIVFPIAILLGKLSGKIVKAFF